MQLKTKSKTEQLNMNRKQKYTKLKSLMNEVRPNPKSQVWRYHKRELDGASMW